ncbi:MAG: helix-turn-helix transcriptional regulator [Verrucomicrobiae bacterium]|nr:helix-turn-helix transcriptional regulator [Verrucomicrobiae bacterium]
MSTEGNHDEDKVSGPATREGAVWTSVGADWRHLGGSFRRHGFSFEWHDFEAGSDVDWSRSFHAGSVEICLNFEGEGQVTAAGNVLEFRPRMAGFYVCGVGTISAQRRAHKRHRFITVELSAEFLRRHLNGYRAWLHPVVQALVGSDRARSGVGASLPLSARQQALLGTLRRPPVLLEGQVLWYQAKAIELVVELLFQPSDDRELFCARARRLAHARVEKVVAILRERLSEPPGLEELGRLVGCSPYYLSRTFSSEMGMTLPQYLRQLRLERAAELLRSGRFNVTEAAMEVGYSSLSHFSQAFHERFGCCPGLFPMSTGPQRALRKADGSDGGRAG